MACDGMEGLKMVVVVYIIVLGGMIVVTRFIGSK